jgi:hypothetical protein
MTPARWRWPARAAATPLRSPWHPAALDATEPVADPTPEGEPTAPPRFLYVIAPARLDLFLKMRRRFLDDDTVHVLLDRRTHDRRVKAGAAPGPERRRQADRRRPTDYWESTAHHPAVLIPLARRSGAEETDRSGSLDPDKESTMDAVRVDAARVLVWAQEGRQILDDVLPGVLEERDALRRERDEAVRRCRELQAENDALRAEVDRVTAAHRQLEHEQAEIAGNMGQCLTQIIHVLEPMRSLADKLGQGGYGRTGG